MTPGGLPAAKLAPGAVIGPDGKLTDGRENFVFRRAVAWRDANPSAPPEKLFPAVRAEMFASMRIDGEWATGLDTELMEKLTRIQPRERTAIYRGEGNAVYTTTSLTPVGSSDQDIAALAFGKRRPINILARSEIDPDAALDRAIRDAAKREVDTTRVATQVVETVQAWLDALWTNDEDALDPVKMLIAPTGAGKTSTLLRLYVNKIATDGRLKGRRSVHDAAELRQHRRGG